MKKLSALMLAFALAVSMGLTAYAEDDGSANNSANITVDGIYQEGEPSPANISVDINWDDMTFVYTAPAKGTWNPETHTYDGSTNVGSWVWQGKTDDKQAPVITVTNHSNVGIVAAFSFATDIQDLTSNFTGLKDGALTLDSAEGTDPDDAPEGETSFSVSGGNITENRQLGTITITVTNVKASPEETLNKMLQNAGEGSTVTLTQDTKLASVLDLNTENIKDNLTIDLGGHTLSNGTEGGMEYLVGVRKGTYTIRNGTLQFGMDSAPMGVVFVEKESDLTLERCTLTATFPCSTLAIYGSVSLKDCTVNSGEKSDEPDNTLNAIELGENNRLTMSGTVNINCQDGVGAINKADGSTVTCLEGTYNFDPTDYVAADNYTITQNEAGTWTVAKNSTPEQ